MFSRVLAYAVVEPGAFEVADRVRDQPFLVTVDGQLRGSGDPLPRRVYEIAAPNDDVAGNEGLRRYEIEMERVN